MILRRALLLLTLTLVVACAPRNVARDAERLADAKVVPIHLVSSRAVDRAAGYLGAKREEAVYYSRLDISIPPNHQVGEVEWPPLTGPLDTAKHFAVVGKAHFPDIDSFYTDFSRAGQAPERFLFVHGYNNTMSEALYRVAQIRADFGLDSPAMLYAWPSAADPRGYVYDRDSVLYARDDLEALLRELMRGNRPKITLVAHSMGSQLLMETLRQIAIKGDRRLFAKIEAVILIAPDLDTDVFRRQAEAMGGLPQPFFIFTSQRDRILDISAFLTGRKQRLGLVTDPEELAGLGVTVVDFSNFKGSNPIANHMIATRSPAAIKVLKGMMAQGADPQSSFANYISVTPEGPLAQ